MLDSDCYEYWLDVTITGSAIETDTLFLYDTDGYAYTELTEHMQETYPSYKFSHSVNESDFYTDGVNAICVVVVAKEYKH